MKVADDRIELNNLPGSMPLETALEGIFKEWGMEYLGGASGYGWSTRRNFMTCPHYYRESQLGHVTHRSDALEIGILFHLLLAMYYKGMVEFLRLREALGTYPVSQSVVMEAYRLFEAYLFRYENDYLIPLDVECREEDEDGNTCRYDLIARVPENEAGIPVGVWNVEHKTTSRFDDAALDGWRSDGEIIGQMSIWRRNKLHKKYGPLQGVIVNLVSKTRVVDFRRILIPVNVKQQIAHARDLKVYEALEKICEAAGVWPRNRASCIGRYGKCSLFEECAR